MEWRQSREMSQRSFKPKLEDWICQSEVSILGKGAVLSSKSPRGTREHGQLGTREHRHPGTREHRHPGGLGLKLCRARGEEQERQSGPGGQASAGTIITLLSIRA